jgi:hypothetical protein
VLRINYSRTLAAHIRNAPRDLTLPRPARRHAGIALSQRCLGLVGKVRSATRRPPISGSPDSCPHSFLASLATRRTASLVRYLVSLHGRCGFFSRSNDVADTRRFHLVNYLLHPPSSSNRHSRPHTAVAIITVYAVLLIAVLATYTRILLTIALNPGYVPRSELWYKEQKAKRKQDRSKKDETSEKTNHDLERGLPSPSPSSAEQQASHHVQGTDYAATAPPSRRNISEPAPGLEEFYSKDVFVCESDGRPRWCATCLNWKPDRAHHCREIGRCVMKMDHFCPW